MSSNTDNAGTEPRDDDGAGSTLRTMVMVVIFVAGVALFARVIRPPQHPLVGKPAPAFALTSLDTGAGSSRVALDAFKGKPVLLDFWATWCGPCRAQSPILEGVANRWKDRGLVVVGVGTNDSAFAAKAWVRQHGITYPIVMDEEGSLSREYGVKNLPTLVLLAKDGTIKAVRVGVTDGGELDKMVQAEL